MTLFIILTIKNEIEIKNIENSHILDGVAVIKFLNWFKNVRADNRIKS